MEIRIRYKIFYSILLLCAVLSTRSLLTEEINIQILSEMEEGKPIELPARVCK